MILLNGEILWHLVWVLPLLAVLFLLSWKKRESFLHRFLGKHANDPQFVTLSKGARIFRFLLLCGVVFFLFLTAARPAWGMQILPYTSSGRDLMIVFDTSRSMLAQDVRPSRLAHAKWLAEQLALKNPGDRFGLIAFAGRAFLECPLTIDRTSFQQSVEDLDTDTIPVGGTNIEEAVSHALKGFSAAEGSTRAIILITDGDELYGDSGKAVNEAIKRKIPLFILGVGDPSQPSIIQVPDGKGNIRTLKDSSGKIVNSPLNEKQLSLLARKTGGIYVRSTATDSGLEEIQTRIRKLDTKERDTGKQTRPIERPLYPLGAAFLLLCLWLLIPERPLHLPGKKVLLLLLLIFPGFVHAAESEKPKAETAEVLYNQACELQKEGKKLKEAISLYEQVIPRASGELLGRANLNLGLIHHQFAGESMTASEKLLKEQQVDPALEKVNVSLREMEQAEGLYKEALLKMSSVKLPAGNQQLLLRDRKKAQELKKKIEKLIEELKKKQQQAQQDTRQANDQQQKQQNQQQREQTEKQTQKAQQSVRDLQEQAKKLNRKQEEQQAQDAGKELEQAREAQKKKQDQKAREHLKKALEHLESKQNQKKDQQKQQQKDQKQSGDNQKDGAKDQQLPQNQPEQKQSGAQAQEKEIDKNQAKALLELMTQDEKSLKDALKQRMKENHRLPSVEKDW